MVGYVMASFLESVRTGKGNGKRIVKNLFGRHASEQNKRDGRKIR